jgi:hypothetical protein
MANQVAKSWNQIQIQIQIYSLLNQIGAIKETSKSQTTNLLETILLETRCKEKLLDQVSSKSEISKYF